MEISAFGCFRDKLYKDGNTLMRYQRLDIKKYFLDDEILVTSSLVVKCGKPRFTILNHSCDLG